jgi:hypothetical protein
MYLLVQKTLIHLSNGRESFPTVTCPREDSEFYIAYENNLHLESHQTKIKVIKLTPDCFPIWSWSQIVKTDHCCPKYIAGHRFGFLVYHYVRDDQRIQLVVVCLDSNGQLTWTRTFPDLLLTEHQPSYSLDLDSDDNGYIALHFHRSDHIENLSLIRINKLGSIDWIWREVNPIIRHAEPYIKVDALHSLIYLTLTECTLTAQEYTDIRVMRFNLEGCELPWQESKDLWNTEMANCSSVMCLDPIGNIYICYLTHGGTAPGQSVTGNQDLVIVKLNSEGKLLHIIQNDKINTPFENRHPSITYHQGFIYLILCVRQYHEHTLKWIKLNALTFEIVTWLQSIPKITASTLPQICVNSQGNGIIFHEDNKTLRCQLQRFDSQGLLVKIDHSCLE